MAFALTKTWVDDEILTHTDLNGNFTDVADVVNEVDTDNELWLHTRTLVGTTTSGGAAASVALTNLSVDLDDYDLEFYIRFSKADTAPNARYYNVMLNGDVAPTNYYSTAVDIGAASVLQASSNTAQITYATQGPRAYSVHGLVYKDIANLPVMQTHSIGYDGVSTCTIQLSSTSRNATLTNNVISGFSITASGDNIDAGCVVTLYKTGRVLT